MKETIIIFDFDGVLADTGAVAGRYMIERYPDMTIELQKDMLCGNWHEEFEKVRQNFTARKYSDEEQESRRNQYIKDKIAAGLFPNIYSMLENLYNAGYTLVINTSAYPQNCHSVIETYKIGKFFDSIFDASHSKSKVEKFKMIIEKYNAKKNNLLFVTDTVGDLRESQRAGVPTIGVTYGVHDDLYFQREQSPVLKGLVNSVSDLYKCLSKLE